MLTGSGLTRAEKCDASVLLPQTRRTTQAATHGHEVHEYLKRVPSMGPEKALAMVSIEHRRAAGLINLEGLPLDSSAYAAEVALAYDVTTGKARELGRNLNRNYSGAGPNEIVGTVDVVGVAEDAVIVPDYKTGWGDLGPLRDNLTMRFYGLAAARTYGRPRARLQLIRIREDEHFSEEWEEDEMGLDSTEYALQKLWTHLVETPVEKAVPHEGPWCQYCPAFTSCPAKMSLLAVVAHEAGLQKPNGESALMPAVLNAETAPVVYDRLLRIDQLMGRLWSSVKEYARVSPIPIGNGVVYGERQHPEDKFDADLSLPLLVERFGPSAESAVEVRRILRKSALQDLVRVSVNGKRDSSGKRLTQKEAYTSVWEELVEKGAARTVYSPRIMEHKPRAALAEGESTSDSERQAEARPVQDEAAVPAE